MMRNDDVSATVFKIDIDLQCLCYAVSLVDHGPNWHSKSIYANPLSDGCNCIANKTIHFPMSGRCTGTLGVTVLLSAKSSIWHPLDTILTNVIYSTKAPCHKSHYSISMLILLRSCDLCKSWSPQNWAESHLGVTVMLIFINRQELSIKGVNAGEIYSRAGNFFKTHLGSNSDLCALL